jgi:hypothetical protein
VTTRQALAFVASHGAVLQAARGALPSFAEAVAGEPIRGSWWAHPKGGQIYGLIEAVVDSGDVLVCTLADGKVTYVHKRLWPALVKLAKRFTKAQLAKVWSEHTPSGAHRQRRVAYPKWVPAATLRAAAQLPQAKAERELAMLLPLAKGRPAIRSSGPSSRATRSKG